MSSLCSISLGLCFFRKQVIYFFQAGICQNIKKEEKQIDFEENELGAFFAPDIVCEIKVHLFLNSSSNHKAVEVHFDSRGALKLFIASKVHWLIFYYMDEDKSGFLFFRMLIK